ncbi:MAG: XdhC family protein [Candidatus Riflebacteria bacterium]|nr:XdhC family protein [Candidatus Riflebacteria bacterium]
MWYEALNRWARAGDPCALLTIIEADGSTPRGLGSKMVVNLEGKSEGSIGGGPVEQISLQEARKAIRENRPLVLRFSLAGDDWRVTEEKVIRAICGGTLTVLIEPVLPQGEIVMFGGGHIAHKLALLCDGVGMPYRVFDNRAEYASPERFPNARERVLAEYAEIPSKIELTGASYCVIMTHGHVHDEACLGAVMQNRVVPYVGMIGSANKVKILVDNLRSAGVPIDDRLYSPVGLALGGKLPEEIALSILAEIKLLMGRGSLAHCRIVWQAPLPGETPGPG